ncbi:lectin subunit alpha-like [Musca autumnalis]|uniref:lectin subunit alpha-like n=1 Tax=Musca autumnalis TaxID=221902 RepID=UPI003CF9AC14
MSVERSVNLSLLFIVTTLLTVVRGVPQWHNSTDGRQYFIDGDQKYNWFQAFRECASRKLQLVEIDTQQKNQALIAVLKPIFGNSHNLWLGATDEYNRDKNMKRPFYWSTSGKLVTFTHWSDKNPDNDQRDEHCVHTWASKPNYQWNDHHCDTPRFGFICENHYLQAEQQNEINTMREKLLKTNAKLFEEYQSQQKEYSEKLKNSATEIEAGETEFKEVLHNVYTKLEYDISHALAQHQREVNSLVEERNKAVHIHNAELKSATEDISKKFTKELEAAKAVYDDVLNI